MGNEEKIDQIIRSYFKQVPNYTSFGENLRQIINNVLKENDISFLSTEYRIKNIEQFLEKINRKKYKQPFVEMTDICGIRIICYFHRDIEQIISLLKNTFEIVEEVNKEGNEDPTKFGYRSKHLIVKVPKSWESIPTFKNTKDLKTEIQVRTVLMHAWAEIEHKLAYKKQSHIPEHLRRKFSRLSAKLEEADEQFEELIDEIKQYKDEICSQAKRDKRIASGTSLNLETLQAFFDFYMPHHIKDIQEIRTFLDEAIEKGINIKELTNLFEVERKKGTLVKTKNLQKEIITKILKEKQRSLGSHNSRP